MSIRKIGIIRISFLSEIFDFTKKIIDNKTKAILLNSHVINASETLPKISKDEIKNIIGKNNLVFFEIENIEMLKDIKLISMILELCY